MRLMRRPGSAGRRHASSIRRPALELLRDPTGVVSGAAGCPRQQDDAPWTVAAGAVVLATGGCAFLSGALGCNPDTGDGHLMAAELGARAVRHGVLQHLRHGAGVRRADQGPDVPVRDATTTPTARPLDVPQGMARTTGRAPRDALRAGLCPARPGPPELQDGAAVGSAELLPAVRQGRHRPVHQSCSRSAWCWRGPSVARVGSRSPGTAARRPSPDCTRPATPPPASWSPAAAAAAAATTARGPCRAGRSPVRPRPPVRPTYPRSGRTGRPVRAGRPRSAPRRLATRRAWSRRPGRGAAVGPQPVSDRRRSWQASLASTGRRSGATGFPSIGAHATAAGAGSSRDGRPRSLDVRGGRGSDRVPRDAPPGRPAGDGPLVAPSPARRRPRRGVGRPGAQRDGSKNPVEEELAS